MSAGSQKREKARAVPLLYKMSAAAEYLGISKTAFDGLIQRGALPDGKLLPGQTRGRVWHRDQLAEFADKWTRP